MSQFAREFPELDPDELYDRWCDDADMRRKRRLEDRVVIEALTDLYFPPPVDDPEEKP